MKILLSIFHKDRSEYLINLLESLEKFISLDKNKISILIFDDSNDKEHLDNLKIIRKKYNFVKIDRLTSNDERSFDTLGKLYIDMNASLKIAKDEKYDYMITIQDDTQFIRKFTDQDIEIIEDIFLKNQKIICINPAFFRKVNCLEFDHIKYGKNQNCYLLNNSSYSDVAIFKIEKLKQLDFKFTKEDKLDKKFLEEGYSCAFFIQPFLNFLPWSVSARLSKYDKYFIFKILKKFLVKINSIGVRAGLHKIYLNEEEAKFMKRNKNIIPTDELYLSSKNELKLPWAYDPYWSIKKFKSFKSIVSFKWIFEGSIEYEIKKKEIERKNYSDKIFYVE